MSYGERLRAKAHSGRDGRWYRIENKADDPGGPVEVFIYDEIDPYWGVSADSFVRDLAAIDADQITVRINSPGGGVYDGIAILNALRAHPATVTTIVDGLAASAASFIAMAGDEIVVRRNAEIMIHDSWQVCGGNAAELRKTADNLDRLSDNIASMYAARAGGTVEEWRALMQAETWYTADEAVEAGLATRVDDGAAEESAPAAAFDLSVFNYAGRRAAPAPSRIAASAAVPLNPSAEPVEVTTEEEEDAMSTLSDGLRQRLGIDADADEDTILAALDEALAERADDSEDTSAAAAAAALPDGVVAIDAAQLEALQAAAHRGEAARARQESDDRVRMVDEAVRAGRIAPVRRQAWIDRLAADPEEATVLASLEPVFPVGDPIGHDTSPSDTADDVYAALYGKDA